VDASYEVKEEKVDIPWLSHLKELVSDVRIYHHVYDGRIGRTSLNRKI